MEYITVTMKRRTAAEHFGHSSFLEYSLQNRINHQSCAVQRSKCPLVPHIGLAIHDWMCLPAVNRTTRRRLSVSKNGLHRVFDGTIHQKPRGTGTPRAKMGWCEPALWKRRILYTVYYFVQPLVDQTDRYRHARLPKQFILVVQGTPEMAISMLSTIIAILLST